MRSTLTGRVTHACLLVLTLTGLAIAAPATQPSKPTTQPSAAKPGSMPGVHVDLKHHWVDIDAKVSQRNGTWLELLACSPGTRDYESLLTVAAKPRHIQLALLMIGLKPGHPIETRGQASGYFVIPPAGPKVRILLRYKKHGKIVQVPANRWLLDQKTNMPMKSDTFLFVGSKFVKYNGKQVFLADLNGSIISLVSFGDEIISRPTTITNGDNGGIWNANAAVVPKIGTPVTIRIEPAPKAKQQP